MRTIRGRIKDKDGGYTDYKSTITINNVSPTPNANGPYSGVPGTPVVFAGSATDPSSADTAAGLAYFWEFGDGATSSQKSPNHTYAAAGTYNVKLTVTDKDTGWGMTTTTVSISSGASDFITTAYLKIPNFGKNPTIVSIGNGAWSSPGTWSLNRLPAAGDIVSIGSGTTVTYDVTSTAALKTVAIQSGATLTFRTDVNTYISVVNFLVMPNGNLIIGTAANPVAANVRSDIKFPDQNLNTTLDPEQFGNGLIALGNVTMHGAVYTPYASLGWRRRPAIRRSSSPHQWSAGQRGICSTSQTHAN